MIDKFYLDKALFVNFVAIGAIKGPFTKFLNNFRKFLRKDATMHIVIRLMNLYEKQQSLRK